MLTTDEIITKVKVLLPIEGEAYDSQLEITVNGAISKLESEGVPLLSITDDLADDYILCVAYQVSMDMDFGVDYDRLISQYITRVNTLRTRLLNV